MITILLVDDQAVVRDGLRAMLQTEPDFHVVGEASRGEQALALAARFKPDVILLDVRMPGMDGLDTLARLKSLVPGSSVIMVTLYNNAEYLLEAVTAGASGYILKDSTREEFVRAVRAVREGGAIISPSMLPELLEHIRQSPGLHPCDIDTVSKLTPREVEVLRLLAQGHTNQQIADACFLSPATVKTHVQNIFLKLGVSDRTQAAVVAVRCGLI